MKITGNYPLTNPSDAAKAVGGATPATPAGAGRPTPSAPARAVDRGDQVQISDAARELAASADAAPADAMSAVGQPVGGLSAARADEIRQRILTGAYHSAQIVDEVARRILERGEL
jgi:hypothetical protein